MAIEKALDNILNSNSKVRIIRLFISKREDFIATGREIARLTDISAPAAHAALKDLYNQDVLSRKVIGKQHLYNLNINNRTVKSILVPAFKKELSVKQDMINFLKNEIKTQKLTDKIVSILFYGSLQKRTATETSDVDIAIITGDQADKDQVEKIFLEDISSRFHQYFGAHLDTYIKTQDEFLKRLRRKQPPISTLIKSYTVVYGKNPLDLH